MIGTHGQYVVEVADAGEIFPDKPTVILVTDYTASREPGGSS